MIPMGDTTEAVIDLAGRARVRETGTAWAYSGADLNANLLVFDNGDGVGEHVNGEVEVLLVGVLGEGEVAINGHRHRLGAGQALVIPKGTRRAIRSTGARFAYLTCHRRRGGLWPEGGA